MQSRVDWFGPPGLAGAFAAITVQGPCPGPRVAITANLHGDECTGIGIVHALLPILRHELLRGTVRLYPSLNPDALEARSRVSPADLVDMNRVFPGDSAGSVSERAARAIWNDLLAFRPDLLVDLHADSALSIPYAILDRPVTLRGARKRDQVRDLLGYGAASGLTVLWDYPEAEYNRFRMDRSLTGALLNHGGVAAVTLEVGPRHQLSPAAVSTGVSAVAGILSSMGVLERPAPHHPSRVVASGWRRDGAPRSAGTGVLLPACTPGARLERGDPIAEVRGIAGEQLDVIQAAGTCYVMSLVERGHVARGGMVATIAVPDQAA